MSHPDLIRFSGFTITSAQADMLARLRPGALTDFLIQAAIQSAESLGFGFKALGKQELFWVLSSMTLRISRPLTWNEVLTVETWPKDIHKLLYLRDFLMRDPAGEIIGRATSSWFAIDHKNHRPRRVAGDVPDIFTTMNDINALAGLPEKLEPVTEGELTEVTSTYFDIDLNGHVTSSRYIDWMMDCIPVDFHRDHYPDELSVNFLKEIRPGEKIRIRFQHDQSLFFFEGWNLSSEMVAFRGRIRFQETAKQEIVT